MLESYPIEGETALRGALARFIDATDRGFLDELMLTGSNLATRLAFSTQPFGDSPAARQQGRNAVAKDIRKVFATPSTIYDKLRREDARTAAQFWHAYRQNDFSSMMRILGTTDYASMETLRVPDKGIHQRRRNRRGKVVGSRISAVVLQRGARDQYTRERQDNVGIAKAGWAAAAEQLNGGSQVPAWASPRAHPRTSGSAVVTGSAGDTVVTIRNEVPWIRLALPERLEDDAVRIAEERLMKRLDIILRKEAAAAGIDSPF